MQRCMFAFFHALITTSNRRIITSFFPLKYPPKTSSACKKPANMLLIFQIAYFMIGVTAASAPVRGMNLDNTTATTTVSGGGSPDDEIKCGGCPCNNPCYIASPPPPPPPPPPPSLPPPKMPSPTPGLNCPPPPTGGGYVLGPPAYIYITGPPENLYPVNPYFSGAHRNSWAAPLLLMFGILGVLIIS